VSPTPRMDDTTDDDALERRIGAAERRVAVTLPSWFALFGRSGPWALLAAVLIYFLILRQDQTFTHITDSIAANGRAIGALQATMNSAGDAMHTFAEDESRTRERQLLLAIETCVKIAEAFRQPGGTEACFASARGVETREKK